MKTLKRSIAVLLSILMLMSVLSVAGMTAFADTHTYTVAGSSVAIFGTEWDCANTANDMTDDNNDGVYEKTYTGVAAGSYEFKVTQDHSWDISYGNNGNNYSFNVAADNATVTIIFDSATSTISVDNSAEGDVPATTSDYYVVGEMADLTWDAADAGKMAKNTDGSFTKTFENVVAGSYPIKINNGTWDECYPAEDNWIVNVDADRSTVVVTLSADKNMNVQIIAPDAQEPSVTPVADGYCLIGKINGVENVGEGETNHATVVNTFNKDGSGYSLPMTITEDSYVYVKDTTCTKWYMTAGWLGNNVGTATLYETNTNMPELPEGEFPNKLHVPAGDYTFTLVENADGTLTLSYTEGSAKPTDPSESTAPTTPVKPANPAVTNVAVNAKTDDTITVKFSLKVAEKCVNGEGGLTYDSSVLQLNSFEFLNVTGAYQNTDLHNEVLFNFTDVQNPADFTTAKDFVVATFKALKDATTNVTLSLVELNAVGDTDIPLVTDGNVVGEFTLTSNVTVGTPTEPTSETKPTEPAPKLSVKKKLDAGETTTAKVTNAGNNKVTYTSENTKVATVDKKTGKITALAKGKATIKAKVGNVTISTKITVKNDPTIKNGSKKVKNNQTIKISKGKTLTLNIVGKAAKIKNTVKTSKKNVGKITSKAKQNKVVFKAKKKGTTTLTITINNVKTYKVKVTVK